MAKVVSSTPGRLRVRLASDQRTPEVRDRLHAHAGTKGVTVRTAMASGSVTVHYDSNKHVADDMKGMLEDVGVILEDVGEETEEVPSSGDGAEGVHFTAAVGDLNRRLTALTGINFELRKVIPLSIGILGGIKWLRNGLQIGEVPAFILLYYAFDSFHKLNVGPPAAKSSPDSGGPDLEQARGA